MLKVDILNKEGKKVGTVDLDPNIFGVEVKNSVVHRAVVAQLSKKEVTSKSKDRAEVRGGGIKPWKQKGTGRARVGSIRSPLWKGGGKTFGPVATKNDVKRINKKEKRKALHMALSDKYNSKKLVVLDELKMEAIKTKEFVKILRNIKVEKNALVMLNENDEKTMKSIRNVSSVKPLLSNLLNVYDVVKYDTLVVDKKSLAMIK
ncbi:MAG: 50S ribosomal protein L4 [Patescibacteria group bacterium]|nr:50S ribosomal protein L4 [Patescibacteria group bacterium]